MNILVSGGAGFIGSALVRYLIQETDHNVIVVDKLTYAGNLMSLDVVKDSDRFKFYKVDICSRRELEAIFAANEPNLVMHLAAESHVDRSIEGPSAFIQTNIMGTYTLLEVAKEYWFSLGESLRRSFRFHHISTDEVYGDLEDGGFFTEETSYQPSSPYSASKASSDHLVRAWYRTYGFPTIVTNCSNNYGPYHFPEKLIPLMILNALDGKPLPIYGNGNQIRDWLYVEDHVKALILVATKGKIGETYNIGGHNEKRNIEVVELICAFLDEFVDVKDRKVEDFSSLITYVKDRPGHDLRYAIDASKMEQELGWQPKESFDSGLRKTVSWYLSNKKWCSSVLDGSYSRVRLGLIDNWKM